jgi:putative ABC transport system permease protein
MPESTSQARRETWRRALLERLSPLRLTPERERDIVDEISGDLEERWRELIAGGAAEDEAVRLALSELSRGDRLAQHMAPLRQAHAPVPAVPGASNGSVLADVWQDLRYGWRAFTRQPAFALAAVLTLAIGIGANSAIFSVVRGVLLQSLPVKDADRLYRLRMVQPDGSAYTTLSAPDFMSVREMTRVFERVESFTSGTVTMLGAAEPIEVRAASISDGLFTELGLQV